MTEIKTVLGDFVEKVEKFIQLEVALFRVHLSEEFEKKRNSFVLILSGILVGFLGLGVLAVALVHLLSFLTTLPNWACEGIVALFYVGVSTTLLFAELGKKEKQIAIEETALTPQFIATQEV